MNTDHKLPELDGIRGVAILLVFAYHCGRFDAFTLADRIINKGFGFGWVGVDLFFALSGFLITGILFDSRRKGRYLGTFFGRRALRILPVYYLFVLGITVFAAWVAPALANSQRFLGLQGWYWLNGVNFLIATRGDWDAAPFDTGILWSLAIEEQFYLVWPFIVWKLSRETLMKVCVAMMAGAFILRVALRWHGISWAAVYTLTPARMDALAVGAFAALLVRGPGAARRARFARVALLAGTLLVLVSVAIDRGIGGDGPVMQTLGFSAVGWIALAIIVFSRVSPEDSILRRALRSRTLRFFGVYSYALYVVHYVVRNAVFAAFPPLDSLPTIAGLLFPWVVLRAACALAAAVGVALLSWYLVEKRCLALKRFFIYAPEAGTRDGIPRVSAGKSLAANDAPVAEQGRQW